MSLSVIRTELDWVQVSFVGELSPEASADLTAAKLRAQSRNAPEPFELGLIETFVADKGSAFYPFVLRNREFEIYLCPNPRKGSPAASVRLSAYGLTNTKPSVLWAVAVACLGLLGSFTPLALTRIDVATDFQGWEPSQDDMRGVVCAAPYRSLHGTAEAFQTFQYGKGVVTLRVYDKTTEIVVKRKPWMREAWALTGRYDDSRPVWRAEIQLRNQALKELGILSIEQVFASVGALLDYGLRWAQLRVPTNDSTKARWEEDPRWTYLRETLRASVPLQRVQKVSEVASTDRLKKLLVGLVATAAAHYETNGFMETLQILASGTEVDMMRDGVDFAARAEDKRRRILGRSSS